MIRSDEGLTLETSAFESLYNGQIILSTLLIDCSQSPYFSVGFSRPGCFGGAAAILVCKGERDLGRVSKLPRGAGVGVSIEW